MLPDPLNHTASLLSLHTPSSTSISFIFGHPIVSDMLPMLSQSDAKPGGNTSFVSKSALSLLSLIRPRQYENTP